MQETPLWKKCSFALQSINFEGAPSGAAGIAISIKRKRASLHF
jgi:hypothetical protein